MRLSRATAVCRASEAILPYPAFKVIDPAAVTGHVDDNASKRVDPGKSGDGRGARGVHTRQRRERFACHVIAAIRLGVAVPLSRVNVCDQDIAAAVVSGRALGGTGCLCGGRRSRSEIIRLCDRECRVIGDEIGWRLLLSDCVIPSQARVVVAHTCRACVAAVEPRARIVAHRVICLCAHRLDDFARAARATRLAATFIAVPKARTVTRIFVRRASLRGQFHTAERGARCATAGRPIVPCSTNASALAVGCLG